MSAFSKPTQESVENDVIDKATAVPEEFKKVMTDFIGDILNTFPEYAPVVRKWWSMPDLSHISNEDERAVALEIADTKRSEYVFKHCLNLYPERFFDILYKNVEMYGEDSTLNTEFLPGISFKVLWNDDISDSTKETIWKYLQLIMMSIVGSIKDKSAFGDTAKLFEAINEDDFKIKLEETMNGMQHLFNDMKTNAKDENAGKASGDSFPSHEDIHGHISGMLGGKLGDLAKEIAEETAGSLNIDMENMTDTNDIFSSLLKNPTKLMGLVKNVGTKLDSRIKSGEINEKELYAEATDIMGKMKDMPGMENIQELLGKMGGLGGMGGMGGMGGNMNPGAMKANMDREMKMVEMQNRMKAKMQKRNEEELKQAERQKNAGPAMTEAEIEKFINEFDGPVEKTPRGAKKPETSGKNKKGGKKKKKA